MSKIFLSYRREDSQHVADRIFDRLARDFDRATLFKDVDNIPIGVNFKRHLDEAVSQTDVMLAIIGSTWADMGHRQSSKWPAASGRSQ